MSDLLIVSLFLLVISLILAITSSWAVIRPRSGGGGHININVPLLGTIKTNYLAMGVAFLSLVLGYLVFSLWKDEPLETINFAGTVTVDQAALTDIDAVVIGMTSSSWNRTITPRGNGKLNFNISVPKSWIGYTAYAFAYGKGRVRPAVVAVTLGDPNFALELTP